MCTSKDLTIIDDKDLTIIDDLVAQCTPLFMSKNSRIRAAIAIAKGINKLREIFQQSKELTQTVTALQGTALGFFTDKDDKGGYPQKIFMECAVEALLRGLNLHNNEWNIISGKMYITKNGMRHLLEMVPGLTDLQTTISPPQREKDYAKLKCRATWKLKGTSGGIGLNDTDLCIIPIKVNAYMGDDGILGKAQRKLYARIYERVTGVAVSEGDAVDIKSGKLKDITPEVQSTEQSTHIISKPAFKTETPSEEEQHKIQLTEQVEELLNCFNSDSSKHKEYKNNWKNSSMEDREKFFRKLQQDLECN